MELLEIATGFLLYSAIVILRMIFKYFEGG